MVEGLSWSVLCGPARCRRQGARTFRSSTYTAAGARGSLGKCLSSPFSSGQERQLCYPLGGWGRAISSIIFLTQILPLREHYGACLQPTLGFQTTLLLPLSLHSPSHAAGMVCRGEGGLILLAGFFLPLDLCALLS